MLSFPASQGEAKDSAKTKGVGVSDAVVSRFAGEDGEWNSKQMRKMESGRPVVGLTSASWLWAHLASVRISHQTPVMC